MQLQEIIFFLTTYKYFFLFPVTVIEGPIITVIAGFLISLGILNPFVAYIVVVVGDVVGDIIYYAIGYYGREKFIKRWGRFIGVTVERAESLEQHFEKHSGKTLFVGKLSHAVGAVVILAAGMAKMPFWKFVWYTTLPSLPKSLVLLFIGFYFGQAYVTINSYLNYTTVIMTAAAILFIVIYFVVKKISKNYEEKHIN